MKIVRYQSTWNPTEPAAVAEAVDIAPHLTRTAIKVKRITRPEQQDVFAPAVVQAEPVFGWFDESTVRPLPRFKVRTLVNFGLGTPGPSVASGLPEGWQEQSARILRRRPLPPEQQDVLRALEPPPEPVYGWFDQPIVRVLPRLRVRTSQNFGLGTPGPEVPEELIFPDGWWEQSAVIRKRYRLLTQRTVGLGTAGAAPSGFVDNTMQIMTAAVWSAS